MRFFESFAAIPVIFTAMLFYIATAKYFDLSYDSIGDPETVRGNWISFFSASFGVTGTWIAIASPDYFVDFPESTPAWQTMTLTWLSILLPTAFVCILGIGLASGAMAIASWEAAYSSLGNGGLLTEAFSVWHAGGKFLIVVLYISLVSNNILNTYSIALSSQVWGFFL